MLRSQKF